MTFQLNENNYKEGFLVDDENIAGVTEMGDGSFAAYVSHYLTGETYAYQEFASAPEALAFLAAMPGKTWVFEGVGCEKHQSSVKSKSGCGSCGSSGACG